MLRRLSLAAVVLAATAPLARGDDPKPPATPLERIEALQKDLNQKLTTLQADVAALKTQVARLDTTQNVMLDTWELRNHIESLQAEVARLREQLAAAVRAAMPPASNLGPAPVPPAMSNLGPNPGGYNRMPDGRRDSNKVEPSRDSQRPPLGTFRIINRLPRSEVVRVNGREEYTLAPGDVVDVPLSPGPFTYQVLGIDLAPRTSIVVVGKVSAATIHP